MFKVNSAKSKNSSAPNLGRQYPSWFILRVCYYFKDCLQSFKHDWINLMSWQALGSSHPWCCVTNSGTLHGFMCRAVGQSEAAALLPRWCGLSPLYRNSALYCHNICTVQVLCSLFNIKWFYIQEISPIIWFQSTLLQHSYFYSPQTTTLRVCFCPRTLLEEGKQICMHYRCHDRFKCNKL